MTKNIFFIIAIFFLHNPVMHAASQKRLERMEESVAVRMEKYFAAREESFAATTEGRLAAKIPADIRSSLDNQEMLFSLFKKNRDPSPFEVEGNFVNFFPLCHIYSFVF